MAKKKELGKNRDCPKGEEKGDIFVKRSGYRGKKKLIEKAYQNQGNHSLEVWCEDEAGPYQPLPHPGESWAQQGNPARLPHEYVRQKPAKLLTLFHPADGRVKVKGVQSCTNSVLHPWLEKTLTQILRKNPGKTQEKQTPEETLNSWRQWQEGLKIKFSLPEKLPVLRMLLVMDNLQGHKTPEFVVWLVKHGIMPLYTPVSGSWLNMSESIQNILKKRALRGQHPKTSWEIIQSLEGVAHHWNKNPTPFVWGGKRAARRNRAREKRHALAASGAFTKIPIRKSRSMDKNFRTYNGHQARQVTH